MPNEKTATFHVTEDHVILLKRLCLQSHVCVNGAPDWKDSGLFTCRPDVNKKRPFGNSGDPAWSALEELGIGPNEKGEYGPAWVGYARRLLIELPVAYEAVMAHGAVEPCTEAVSLYNAWYGYAARLALEYWREALEEAARGIPEELHERLVGMAMNLRHGSPDEWARDLHAMADADGASEYLKPVCQAVDKYMIRKWREANPGRILLSDAQVLERLLTKKLSLEWPGQASRPEGKAA